MFQFFLFLKQNLDYNFFYYSVEFSTSALAGCFSLQFEWQQVSSSLQDSSKYSYNSQ